MHTFTNNHLSPKFTPLSLTVPPSVPPSPLAPSTFPSLSMRVSNITLPMLSFFIPTGLLMFTLTLCICARTSRRRNPQRPHHILTSASSLQSHMTTSSPTQPQLAARQPTFFTLTIRPVDEHASQGDCTESQQQQKETQKNADVVCMICLDDCHAGNIAAGPCAHWAHYSCLSEWLSRDPMGTCPTCRRSLAATPLELGHATDVQERDHLVSDTTLVRRVAPLALVNDSEGEG